RRYWMRMFIPFAFDIPFAIAIFLSGHLLLLNGLILGLCALIHINHLFSVDRAERQVRPFSVPEGERPVASPALSLAPDSLRDYTNRKVEWALALSTMIALAWLARYYLAAPEHHNLRLVFGVPILYLYLQAGMLLVKRGVVAWRAPIPQAQAAEHVEAREETRKYYLKLCDWSRAGPSAGILFWPIHPSASLCGVHHLFSVQFFA